MLYHVKWETDGADVDLPLIVEASSDLDEALEELSNRYGWLISDLNSLGNQEED